MSKRRESNASSVVRRCAGMVVLLLFLSVVLSGCDTDKDSEPAVGRMHQEGGGPSKGEQTALETKYCPAPEALEKQGLIWRAPGGWRSYSGSFVKEIHGFSGAQWVGIKLGKIICIYGGTGQTAFPVSIERDNLVSSPRQSVFWGPDQGGYRNCKGEQVQDCPYEMKKTPKKQKDVYEGLRDFVK